jgi:uncharacterized damage-inducible protein DinB
MNKEIESVIVSLTELLYGEPWYGKSANAVFKNIDPAGVHKKPSPNSHSLIELLYHMITWVEFTLEQVDSNTIADIESFEKRDWRIIDAAEHSWDRGLQQFIDLHQQLILSLKNKNDNFLDKPVTYRDYNFRYLLHGLIQHNIYHLGQIVYLDKLLKG